MEMLLDPPAWAWFALAGGLLIVEVLTGTFFFLWPAAAAGLVGLAAGAPLGTKGLTEWFLFAGLSLILAFASRAMGLKRNPSPEDKRAFNTSETFIGRRALALSAFSEGRGRVRLGDTDWLARTEDHAEISEGQALFVSSVDGNELVVRPSD